MREMGYGDSVEANDDGTDPVRWVTKGIFWDTYAEVEYTQREKRMMGLYDMTKNEECDLQKGCDDGWDGRTIESNAVSFVPDWFLPSSQLFWVSENKVPENQNSVRSCDMA